MYLENSRETKTGVFEMDVAYVLGKIYFEVNSDVNRRMLHNRKMSSLQSGVKVRYLHNSPKLSIVYQREAVLFKNVGLWYSTDLCVCGAAPTCVCVCGAAPTCVCVGDAV